MKHTPYGACVLFLGCLFLISLSLAGCSSTKSFRSVPGAHWSGAGLSFPLPTGAWRVSKLDEVDGTHLQSGTTHIIVTRKAAREDVPVWLRISTAFTDFRDKELLDRQSFSTAQGLPVDFAEYLVREKNAELRMKAWAVRQDGYDVLFMGWDSSGGPAPDLGPSVDDLEVLDSRGKDSRQ